MAGQMRCSGVDALGDVPWGTHIYHCYHTPTELLEVLPGFFRQGLEDNELCVWVMPEALGVEEAKSALQRLVPDLDERIRRGQIEFIDSGQMYLSEDRFDARRVLDAWLAKEQAALARGFEGMRAAGVMPALEESGRKAIIDYEAAVGGVIGRLRALALCSHRVDQYKGIEIIDMLRHHSLVLVKQEGRWEVIQSPQQQRMEQSLRESQRKTKAVLDTIPDPAWLKDTEGRFVAVNAGWSRFIGVPGEEALGKTVLAFFPTETAEVVMEQDRRIIQSRQSLRTEELLKDKDGSPVWFETIRTPMLDDRGDAVGTVGLARNITARRRAEEEKLEMERRLLHAQKLESLGVLAGGIAHDFNNLMAGIIGYADLALLRLPAAEPARADIEVIKKAARRAADLTGQMLAYSGKGKFVVEPVNLSQIVEDSKKILAMSVSKNASLVYRLASELPAIQADASQMCQIVMNLIINASEALGEQRGVIAVSTSAAVRNAKDLAGMGLDEELPEGLYVCLEVADTGCGMDGPTQAKIFEPFFTTKFTGRGLGLAAVHGIVRGHNGGIQVISKPGRGATFRVLLPAAGPLAAGAPAATVRSVAAPIRPPAAGTILIVDDEPLVRTLVQRMVEHAGYDAMSADGGHEAIRLFREHHAEVSCVLLDRTMPDLDGLETFRELRRIRPDVRVILSSGYSEEAATEQFAEQGLAGFIQKPYQLDALIAKLRLACSGVSQ
jgi:PAS domain S-box-containing protein